MQHRSVGRAFALGTLALLLASSPALAQTAVTPQEEYTLRLEYLWWSPQPEGEIQKGVGDFEGTLLDIRSDLGVGEGKANPFRGTLRLGGSWKLRGAWSPLDFRGDTPSPLPFVYGTVVVSTGDRVITSLKGNYFSTEVEWDFVERPGGFLGAFLGVKYFDVDTVLVNARTGARVAEREQLPIPVLGLATRTYLGQYASLEGEFSGITAGSRGHLWEWLIALRLHLSDRLAATGGYRKLSVEGRDDRDSFTLDLGTWTFGVEISI